MNDVTNEHHDMRFVEEEGIAAFHEKRAPTFTGR
jgi:hypothetical protein